MTPRLNLVVPHCPIDNDVNEVLATACLASLPSDSGKVVVVNEGTGFATGQYVGVVTNDSRVEEGDVYDLCVPGTVEALVEQADPAPTDPDLTLDDL